MRLVRVLMSIALVAIVATSAFAFMATNTVADSYAGEGQGAVKPFVVTDISYTISPTDPSLVMGVSFTLNPPDAKTVFVKYEPPEGGWTNCPCFRQDHTATWICAWTLPIQLQTITELEVMAAQ